MLRIKQLFRYLLPVLALPLLTSVCSTISTLVVGNYLGSAALAASSTFTSLTSMAHSPLYIIAMVCLVVTAILSETGKTKAARIVHIVMFCVYGGTLLMDVAIFLFAPGSLLRAVNTPTEIMSMNMGMLRIFAVMVFVIALTGGLIAQLVRKYSMILTLCLGFGLQVFSVIFLFAGVVVLGMGVLPVGLAGDIEFAACRVLPFVMIPMTRYYKSFNPNA